MLALVPWQGDVWIFHFKIGSRMVNLLPVAMHNFVQFRRDRTKGEGVILGQSCIHHACTYTLFRSRRNTAHSMRLPCDILMYLSYLSYCNSYSRQAVHVLYCKYIYLSFHGLHVVVVDLQLRRPDL